jgi:tRNA threonylcarbamoyl adenosine modification protein (Sua5/YciO/YrdC/YwlC family)
MLITIHPDNPNPRQISYATDILRKGGVIIYPTDTVYGIGCDIFNAKAVERVAKLKGIKIEKAKFSFICYDLSHLSDFTQHLSSNIFKLMKRNLPGPFTFILPANSNIPKLFKNKKRTVGIRIPDHKIPLEIVKNLGNPILTTSLHDDDEIIDYTTDPEYIHEKYEHLVDLVIDGGYGNNQPSTVIDCTVEEPFITRQGKGIVEE